MTTQEKIDHILKELIADDPEFGKVKDKLKEALSNLLALNESVHIDAEFKNKLKRQLLNQTTSPVWSLKELFTMKKFSYILAAILLVAVGATGSGVYLKHTSINSQDVASLFPTETKITNVSKNAFGSLANVQSAPVGGGGNSERSTMAAQQSAAYSTVPEMAAAPQATLAAPAEPTPDAKMIAPYTPYSFKYTGDPLTLSDTEGDVYKRVKSNTSGGALANILKTISLGLININKFQSLAVQSFTLAENRDFGYMITVNAQEGTIYVNENWEKWMTPDRTCQDEACFNRYRIKQSDVPSDATLIDIANKFLDSYGISKTTYANPTVQKYWQDPVSMSRDAANVYIPDVISVVYPLKIGDQAITDEGGYSAGLNVMVNIRQKKVSGVNELTSNTFESSKYALETDTKRIISFAEKGGGYYYGMPENQTTNVVTLGTPTHALVRTWTYNGALSQELFVPALVFPVTGTSNKDMPYYAQQVTVPLVKEILEQRSKQPSGGVPVPMSTPGSGGMMEAIPMMKGQ